MLQGVGWSDTESLRSTVVHFPWKKSKYLETRKEELKEVINELCPHKPVNTRYDFFICLLLKLSATRVSTQSCNIIYIFVHTVM